MDHIKGQISTMGSQMTEILALLSQTSISGLTPRKRQHEEATTGDKNTANVTENDIIDAVRKALGKDEPVTFRSPEQKEALESVCLGRSDGLYILPTGSGKSLLFMVPGILFPNLRTVVIVPLVALQNDLVRKCKEVGINAVKWK